MQPQLTIGVIIAMASLRHSIKVAAFKFREFSKKQRMIFSWWTDESPVKDAEGIIADGAIRSGKTLCMSLSFVMWAMTRYNGQNFGMCGKTVKSFERNVLSVLKLTLKARGYKYQHDRTDNLLIVQKGDTANNFYIFGGKDESSQDLVQGITFAGVFFDEVALMPESFVNQATARCSVDGSKFWFNCNPGGPTHWFKVEWLDQMKQRKLLHLHFTLDDNLSLSDAIKDRYRNQYSGVFYQRYILGLWVLAEGIIYDMFDYDKHVRRFKDIAKRLTTTCYISCDYGTQNPMVYKMWVKGNDKKWYCTREYYYSGRDEKSQKTDADYITDLNEFAEGSKPRALIVDPSAASFIAAARNAGWPVIKAKNDVLDGIRFMSVCLNEGRIMYCDTCEHTIDEFGAYVWDEKAVARGEDAPLKLSDHCMDADRYFLYTILYKKKAKIKNKAREGFY